MDHEVVVVGAGIGGLTVAALLAARGVDVCVLERGSQPGGVIARFEKFGYQFDPSMGLYGSWAPGEIFDQIFSELPVAPPEVRLDSHSYIVRLANRSDVVISSDDGVFQASLRAAFPDWVGEALAFYERCERIVRNNVDADSATVADQLKDAPEQFRHFIAAQLQMLVQCSVDECNLGRAAITLASTRQPNFSIKGGAAGLAETLMGSIKTSGGRLRFDTPVLRLAYDSSGQARGVELLSGETVHASRAIISNLTLWDTYGKLIGFSRTPPEVRRALKANGLGAYLVFVGVTEPAMERLPGNRILIANQNDVDATPLMLAASPSWDPRAPSGYRAASLVTFIDVDHWFTYHETAEDLEALDQTSLEATWQTLHQGIPELGDGAEVIDTVTPFDCYEQTRRKLGMVSVPQEWPPTYADLAESAGLSNVFMVGNTCCDGMSLAAVAQSALKLALKLGK